METLGAICAWKSHFQFQNNLKTPDWPGNIFTTSATAKYASQTLAIPHGSLARGDYHYTNMLTSGQLSGSVSCVDNN